MNNETLVTEKKVAKKPAFVPSEHQKNIFDFINLDTKNAVISAVAGSGKTTTLLKSLELIPVNKTVLFLAFNKSISDELRDRVPKRNGLEVKTVHGFGYSILNDNFKTEIDNSKYRIIYKNIIDFYSKNDATEIKKYNFNKEHIGYIEEIRKCIGNRDLFDSDFRENVFKLCNLGRLHFINFEVKSIGVSELTLLSNIHSIPNVDYECEAAWYLSKLGVFYTDMIDYTDMIFLPNFVKYNVPKYDFVFIDECQDLNTCQRLLMIQAMKPDDGRFIAVGDPKQAIYSFAGADAESYKKLKDLPNTIELPLSVTYRCAKEIVDRVKHINPEIEPSSKKKKGIILENFSYLNIKDGDMVLCRNTFPVVSLCIRLLCEGKKAFIIGSDIGLSLKNMITNSERKREEYNMVNVISRLTHEKDKMIEKIMTKNGVSKQEASKDNMVVLFKEKIEIIDALTEDLTNPDDVIKKIEKIFSNEKKQGICLSNIHKSKGLESERVFILHPELMPSKQATLSWQLEQESNLMYVAYTRAKKTLGFITDYDAWNSDNTKPKIINKIVESKHFGLLGSKMYLELTIVDKREINSQFGKTNVYDMLDKDGNRFSKFGSIPDYLFDDTDKKDEVGTTICFYGIIKDHKVFKGENITGIGKMGKH